MRGKLLRVLTLARTAALLAPVAGLAAGLGWWIDASGAWWTGAGVALVAGFATWRYAADIVLRQARALPVDAAAQPHLLAMVRELAARAGLPVPGVCVLDEPAANAFVVGRSARSASLVVTSGMLRLLDESSMRAVLAHQFAHIAHGDMVPATLAAAQGGLCAALAQAGGAESADECAQRGQRWVSPSWLLLAPLAAALAWLGGAQAHVVAADRYGALLCGDPQALARALQQLHASRSAAPCLAFAVRYPAAAQMMFCDPLKPARGGRLRLFRAHLPLARRVQALHALRHAASTASGSGAALLE